MRPWCPPAAAIEPYLRRIDAARWYSNFGPLITEFEARLASRFKPDVKVVTVANATLGLAAALMARQPRPGFTLMPGWTFVATAHAAILAGRPPCLADVDPETGVLTPALARAALNRAPVPIAAVIPVMPHGAPIDLDAWAAFEADTGIPVIVDAAAAFDAADRAPVPVVVSLHATKALGVGEGGFVATTDADLAARIRGATSFGFMGSRDSQFAAMNAKLAETAAAVGLAALDVWPDTRARLMRTAGLVRAAIDGQYGLKLQPGWGARWIGSTCIARTRRGGADRVIRKLAQAGIETRRWWGRGLHREPAFRTVARIGDLAQVERLAASTVGLPFAIDLDVAAINRIALALAAES